MRRTWFFCALLRGALEGVFEEGEEAEEEEVWRGEEVEAKEGLVVMVGFGGGVGGCGGVSAERERGVR